MAGSPTPRAAPVAIAVSVPAQPVSLSPGEAGQLPIRIINPGTAPVTVTVRGMGLDLGNNGKVSFTGEPDPEWSSRTTFPSGELTVPPLGYLDLTVGVEMPAQISPDFYFIGFLVTPVATGTGVVQINQIGSFITINVPGPRVRQLAAVLKAPELAIHLAAVVIGSDVSGTLTVTNTGKTVLQYWGENDSSSWSGLSSPSQQRIPVSLLPIGSSRTSALRAAPSFPIAVVTLSVTVTYNGTTLSSTKQVVLSKTFLVVNPWVIVVVAVLILLALGRWVVMRRLRYSRRMRLASRRRLP
jgi:hypothetical protein